MIFLFVLLISISNHFDISSGTMTVCKSLSVQNDDSTANEMKCNEQMVFSEKNEGTNQQNINDQISAVEDKLTTKLLSTQEEFNQMNKTIEDFSAIARNQSNQIKSLQQKFEQMKVFIEENAKCISRCVNGRCVNENNTFVCSCNVDYAGTNCTEKIYSNCNDKSRTGHTSSGVYNITVPGITNPVQVYCDLNTDGGDWLVFQRRTNGSVDFYRNWTEYQHGFGNLNGEFWLGLNLLHTITASGSYELRVDLEDWNGKTAYAIYRNFSVGNSQSDYRLSVSGYSGTAGDSLNYHNNQPFSTKDRDNDKDSSRHCAQTFHGAWWYNACYNSNLNGKYLRNRQINPRGVVWSGWKSGYSMKRAEMKIKLN